MGIVGEMKIFLALIAFSAISVVASSALHAARASESASSESAFSESASSKSASNESASKANSFLQRMQDASDRWLCKDKIGDKCSYRYHVRCCAPLKCYMNPPFGRCCTTDGCEADGVEIEFYEYNNYDSM